LSSQPIGINSDYSSTPKLESLIFSNELKIEGCGIQVMVFGGVGGAYATKNHYLFRTTKLRRLKLIGEYSVLNSMLLVSS
jgi:hypothetical protein